MTIEYPSADDIHAIHERIVVRSDKTEPGVRTPEAVELALTYISEGYFDEAPETFTKKQPISCASLSQITRMSMETNGLR